MTTVDEIILEMEGLKTDVGIIINDLSTMTTATDLSSKAQEINTINNRLIELRELLLEHDRQIIDLLQKQQGGMIQPYGEVVEGFSKESDLAMDKLEDMKQSNIRQSQINRFYSDKYSAYTELFRLIVSSLIPIIFLLVLKKKGYIRSDAFKSLIIVVFIIGGIFCLKQFIDILSRSDTNFQEIDWKFRVPDEDIDE